MHRHRLLVVEDDPATRDAFVAALEAEGCRVGAASDADEALTRLRAGFSPCTILLDIRLPGKNGWQFRLEQLMDSALAGIPVIVCSGDPAAARDARLFGLPVLVKPVDLACLVEEVGEICRTSAVARPGPDVPPD